MTKLILPLFLLHASIQQQPMVPVRMDYFVLLLSLIGIASVHAQSPSALINAELIAVDSGTHGADIYFYSNSTELKAAVENAPNVRFRDDWEAVIRVCVSRGGRAFCGPVIAWLNCAAGSSSPAAEVCGRGCESWDAQHNRDCADGGAAWAEVPCGSEPGAVCSTSARCGGNLPLMVGGPPFSQTLVVATTSLPNGRGGQCAVVPPEYEHAGITVCCPENQQRYWDGSWELHSDGFGSACDPAVPFGGPMIFLFNYSCALYGTDSIRDSYMDACPYHNCGGLEFDLARHAQTGRWYPALQEDDVLMLPGPSRTPLLPQPAPHQVCPTMRLSNPNPGGTRHAALGYGNYYFHSDDLMSIKALLTSSASTEEVWAPDGHQWRVRQVITNACLYRGGRLMGCQSYTIWGFCNTSACCNGAPTCGRGSGVSSRNTTSGLEYDAHNGNHFPIFQEGDTLVITEGCETSPTPESPQPDPHLECISKMLALPSDTLNATLDQLELTTPACAEQQGFAIRVSTSPNILSGTCTQEGTWKGNCPTDLTTAVRAGRVEVVLEIVYANNTAAVFHSYSWYVIYSLYARMVVSGPIADVTDRRTHHGTLRPPNVRVEGRVFLYDPVTGEQRTSWTLNEVARMTVHPARTCADVVSVLRVEIADRITYPVTTPTVHPSEEMGGGLQWEVRFVRPGPTSVTVHTLVQPNRNGTRRLLEDTSELEVSITTVTFDVKGEDEDESWTSVILGAAGGACVLGVAIGVALRGLHRRNRPDQIQIQLPSPAPSAPRADQIQIRELPPIASAPPVKLPATSLTVYT